jgi:hypothetical protein
VAPGRDVIMCMICSGAQDSGVATPSGGLAFDCLTHGAYAVARMALPRFAGLDKEAQIRALESARVFASKRGGEIVITSLDL